jgi:hypothetical protein
MRPLTQRQLQILSDLAYQQREGYPPSPLPTKEELTEVMTKLSEMKGRRKEVDDLFRRLGILDACTD